MADKDERRKQRNREAAKKSYQKKKTEMEELEKEIEEREKKQMTLNRDNYQLWSCLKVLEDTKAGIVCNGHHGPAPFAGNQGASSASDSCTDPPAYGASVAGPERGATGTAPVQFQQTQAVNRGDDLSLTPVQKSNQKIVIQSESGNDASAFSFQLPHQNQSGTGIPLKSFNLAHHESPAKMYSKLPNSDQLSFELVPSGKDYKTASHTASSPPTSDSSFVCHDLLHDADPQAAPSISHAAAAGVPFIGNQSFEQAFEEPINKTTMTSTVAAMQPTPEVSVGENVYLSDVQTDMQFDTPQSGLSHLSLNLQYDFPGLSSCQSRASNPTLCSDQDPGLWEMEVDSNLMITSTATKVMLSASPSAFCEIGMSEGVPTVVESSQLVPSCSSPLPFLSDLNPDEEMPLFAGNTHDLLQFINDNKNIVDEEMSENWTTTTTNGLAEADQPKRGTVADSVNTSSCRSGEETETPTLTGKFLEEDKQAMEIDEFTKNALIELFDADCPPFLDTENPALNNPDWTYVVGDEVDSKRQGGFPCGKPEGQTNDSDGVNQMMPTSLTIDDVNVKLKKKFR